jgi:hypothetical protein
VGPEPPPEVIEDGRRKARIRIVPLGLPTPEPPHAALVSTVPKGAMLAKPPGRDRPGGR